MKLYYFEGEDGVTNFGDELNRYLWPRLLPGVLDDDDETLFAGIGTLLNDRLPAARRVVVFGSGVGYYGPPQRHDGWTIYCVRGPLSAAALGVPATMAVTDPGALIGLVDATPAAPEPAAPHAFMPHWQSEPSAWQRVCEDAGLAFLDPRWPVERVVAAIRATGVLFTEAMHGAIVADALRVPWVPVRTRPRINAFKWEDWCGSLALEYRPHDLPTIWPEPPGAGPVRTLRRRVKLTLAGRALSRLRRDAPPVLSRATVLDARVGELRSRLDALRVREGAQRYATTAK